MAPNVLLRPRNEESSASSNQNVNSASDNSASSSASSSDSASSTAALPQALTNQPWFIAVVVIGSLALLAAVCFFAYTYYRTKNPRRRTSREFANYQQQALDKKSASSSPTASLRHLSLPGYIASQNSKSSHKHSRSRSRKLATQERRALEMEAQREMALQRALQERPLPSPPRPARTEGLFDTDTDTDAETLLFMLRDSIHQRNSFAVSTDSFPRPPTTIYNPRARPHIHHLAQRYNAMDITETDVDSSDDEDATHGRRTSQLSLRSEMKAYEAGLVRSQSEHHEVHPMVKATDIPAIPPMPGSISLRSVFTTQTGGGSLLSLGVATTVDFESASNRASLMPVPLHYHDVDAAMVASQQPTMEQLSPVTFEPVPPVPPRSTRRDPRPRSRSLGNPNTAIPGSDIIKVTVPVVPAVLLHKSRSIGHVRNADSFASTVDGEISPGIDSYEVLLARENSNRQLRRLKALFNHTPVAPSAACVSPGDSVMTTPVSSYFPPVSEIASVSSYSDMSSFVMPSSAASAPVPQQKSPRYSRSAEPLNAPRERPNYKADRSRSVDVDSRKQRQKSLHYLRAQHMRSQSSKLPPGGWKLQESILDVTGAAARPAVAPLPEGEAISEFEDSENSLSLVSSIPTLPRRSSKRNPARSITMDAYGTAATPPSTPPRTSAAVAVGPSFTFPTRQTPPTPSQTPKTKPISRSQTVPLKTMYPMMAPDNAKRYPAIEPEIADRSMLVYRPVTRAPASLRFKKADSAATVADWRPRRWRSTLRLSFEATQRRSSGEGEMNGRLDGPLGDMMPAF